MASDPLWTARAIASLSNARDWMAERDPRVAEAITGDIVRTIGLLAEFPHIGQEIPGLNLRWLLTRTYRYRIIYRIRPGAVEIRDILHPRQNAPR